MKFGKYMYDILPSSLITNLSGGGGLSSGEEFCRDQRASVRIPATDQKSIRKASENWIRIGYEYHRKKDIRKTSETDKKKGQKGRKRIK